MIFICSMLMFITSHLLIAHDCSHEHRYSRLWVGYEIPEKKGLRK